MWERGAGKHLYVCMYHFGSRYHGLFPVLLDGEGGGAPHRSSKEKNKKFKTTSFCQAML